MNEIKEENIKSDDKSLKRDRPKALPFIPVSVKDVSPKLKKVSIVGTVVSKNPELYSFALDDGEATIIVITNNIDRFNEIKEGQTVRALGSVWGEGDEAEIQADIIQDFSKIDREMYKNTLIS